MPAKLLAQQGVILANIVSMMLPPEEPDGNCHLSVIDHRMGAGDATGEPLYAVTVCIDYSDYLNASWQTERILIVGLLLRSLKMRTRAFSARITALNASWLAPTLEAKNLTRGKTRQRLSMPDWMPCRAMDG
jgi:hypothetical protein